MIENILKEKSSWESLRDTKLPVIVYGTGNGADAVLDRFQASGIKVSEIMASDGFVRERSFRGFKVKSLSQVEEAYGDFVIALSFASSLPEVMNSIKAIEKCHGIIMPVVPVFGNEIMDREYLTKNAESLEESCNMLSDEKSKSIFENMLRFQFSGKLSYLFESESTREEALKDILKLSHKENILDLGAYRGDTLEEIVNLFGGFSSALCFEPDPKTFKKLALYAEGKSNIKILPYAAFSEEKTFTFSGGGGRQSALCEEGKLLVKAVAVDDILENNHKTTYVKMDVEGAESKALLGMKNLLREQKPKLSIACYHRTDDLTTLIPLIKSLNPDYKIFLRHHPYIPFWDTNLYCI